MFHTQKHHDEMKIRKIKLQKPARAGSLWKGIPFKEVIDTFNQMTTDYKMACDEQTIPIATGGRKNSAVVVSSPFYTYKDKYVKGFQKLSWTPVVSVVISNGQEFTPTFYLGAQSKLQDGPLAHGYCVPIKSVCVERQTLNFDFHKWISFEFATIEVRLKGLYESIDQLACQPLFKQYEMKVDELILEVPRRGILQWDKTKYIDEWVQKELTILETERMISPSSGPSVLDFSYIVSKIMNKTDPVHQPDKLFQLYGLCWEYYRANE